jgi:hypothetical protein
MEKIKNLFKWLVFTNIGRIIGSFLFGNIFYFLSSKTYEMGKDTLSNVFLVFACFFGVVLLSHILVMFAYAWFINPIRDYCTYKGKGSKFCKIFCKKCD